MAEGVEAFLYASLTSEACSGKFWTTSSLSSESLTWKRLNEGFRVWVLLNAVRLDIGGDFKS